MFLHGCNYPWSTDGVTAFYGLDFGANVWGTHLGVSTRREAVAADLAGMAALGFTVVRWFLFCDGRAGIVYDERELPLGPDAHLFADTDAALELASQAGIQIDFVLLDHHWMFSGIRQTIADPAMGVLHEARLPEGRAPVLLSAAGRDALFHRVLIPLVRRYGAHGDRSDLGPSIAAYELMNEPDFVVEEWERDLSPRVKRPLPFELLAGQVAWLSEIVHTQHSGVLTTIGCARLHNLWAWDDDALGLDVLELHSYPDERYPERDADVFGMPASSLGVRRRVILGEFPANAPEHHPEGAVPPPWQLDEYLEFAVSAGYAGAWPWSFSGTDAYGRIPAEPLRRFAARHPTLVNPRARI
ncbi:MAG: hypothetical protein A3F70_10945 [Acidobacteria bacterium RIFCSPLOWO2_12_FULL_67_14]|nr:MAG: hypothetical protein A3H29_05555 [Acidobacteria bacterium RIFCSPLOWO2_02_FULL_67_21]OFW39338.1 MAG: hypothetical protein A3F70_10945 [Acidobacteria bacterium RIFCSPLOWO2_12_FULL_67_14]